LAALRPRHRPSAVHRESEASEMRMNPSGGDSPERYPLSERLVHVFLTAFWIAAFIGWIRGCIYVYEWSRDLADKGDNSMIVPTNVGLFIGFWVYWAAVWQISARIDEWASRQRR
jgi:hypothetical protein